MTDEKRSPLPSVEERYGAPTGADLVPANYLERERFDIPDPLSAEDAIVGVARQLTERWTRAPRLHRMKYSEYLKSPEWREIRREILRLARYRCERCDASNVRLQVHHKTYVNRGYEEIEDLEAVCDACHKKEHGIVSP